jgi:hypothetical protein
MAIPSSFKWVLGLACFLGLASGFAAQAARPAPPGVVPPRMAPPPIAPPPMAPPPNIPNIPNINSPDITKIRSSERSPLLDLPWKYILHARHVIFAIITAIIGGVGWGARKGLAGSKDAGSSPTVSAPPPTHPAPPTFPVPSPAVTVLQPVIEIPLGADGSGGVWIREGYWA